MTRCLRQREATRSSTRSNSTRLAGLKWSMVLLAAGVVVGVVFAGDADVDGGEAVSEGVEFGVVDAGLGFGAGGFLGIAPVGFELALGDVLVAF